MAIEGLSSSWDEKIINFNLPTTFAFEAWLTGFYSFLVDWI